MSLYTLLGLDDQPAELTGFGPVLADIARQVAQQHPHFQWRFSVYDEIDALVAHGITRARPTREPPDRSTRRRPSAQVASFVRTRNRTCIAPGCRKPARSCDLDHTVAWADNGHSGPTNLGPVCRGHHLLKHAPGCDVTQSSTGGTFGWTTPRGMRYLTRPDPPLYRIHEQSSTA